MKRLKIYILIFFVSVSAPLGYVIWRTYEGLAQEELAQVRFFGEALFDEMEKTLAGLVQREENRRVDEYHHTLASADTGSIDGKPEPSPLAKAPSEAFILGYLQNNPDGSFQTPLVADLGNVPPQRRELINQIREVNRTFNRKKFSIHQKTAIASPAANELRAKKKEKAGFADRFLAIPQRKAPKAYLGQKSSRTEEITARQALNLAQEDEALLREQDIQAPAAAPHEEYFSAEETPHNRSENEQQDQIRPAKREDKPSQVTDLVTQQKFQVEVAPLQSVFINDDQVFIFRRIMINDQIYRQGFAIIVQRFLHHLAAVHFDNQPLAKFMQLRLQIMNHGRRSTIVSSGDSGVKAGRIAERTFPAPFDFLSAALLADNIPASPARGPLQLALMMLGAFMLLGLLAIYHSARTVVDMSERKTQFVSSVTHELKTPLTNIRMYIEMLEQGIALTPEREQEYLRILGSESTRLARLINNVLELAKLEKKQRTFNLQPGRLDDVFIEVRTLMAEKLQQEGFLLEIASESVPVPVFAFDREVMVQVLINLIENAVKFGRHGARRKISISASLSDGYVRIDVSDTGPGIPRQALKKIFDDFYRADNEQTRSAGGTGIGLALVRKFVIAMGGRVHAANNTGPGCTITLFLPLNTPKSMQRPRSTRRTAS